MDIKVLESQYLSSPTPALVSALNKAYQEQAYWFFKTQQFNNDSTIFYFDKAVVLLENARPVPYDLLAELYNNLCEYRIKRTEYYIAVEMGNKALSFLNKLRPAQIDKLLQYEIIRNTAYAELLDGNTERGLELFTRAGSLMQYDKRSEIQAIVLKDKGAFYAKYNSGVTNTNSEGLSALFKSAQYYENTDKTHPAYLADIYKDLMWYYNVKWGNNKVQVLADSCDYYFSKINALLPLLNNPLIENWYYSHRANVALRRGQYEEATALIQKSIKIIDTYHLEFDRLYPFNLNLLGIIAYKKKQWVQAESYFTKARDISIKQKNPRSELTYLTHMGNLYEAKGDYKKAIIFNTLWFEKMAGLREERSNKNLKESELQLNILRQEKELVQKSAERNLFFGATLIALLLLGSLAFIFLRERRIKAKLEAQNHIIEGQSLALRQLDAAKNRFFTNITHEFRTPLTVILGNLEIEKSEIEKIRNLKIGKSENSGMGNPGVIISQFLNFLISKNNIISRNSESLLRLINQILDLAKLESNTLKINYTQGNVLPFLKNIIESLHSLANAQNLMLRVESAQPEIIMDYDPERILQIVHNLLSNAIKFTRSGGKVVLRADVKENWLYLTVSDTGMGIPADELPHLFERFFQAKNQEHANTGGTGIGLSLTKELINALGGEISVESTVGVGTTFLVKLPVTNNAAFVENWSDTGVENWNASVANPQNRLTTPPPGTETSLPQILLVEDNPDVVEYLTTCLDEHFQLDFAYNGRAGIEKALEIIPDLIISDVMMPEKDGFEVVETLKNDERSSHIPIILLTAKADVQSRLAGLRRGADTYLSKPFHQEELMVTVANLLELRKKLQSKYQQKALTYDTDAPPAAADPEDSFLHKVHTIVASNYTNEAFGLPQLCQKIGMSRSQLFRKMKALTDMAPSDLIRKHRLNKAQSLLKNGTANVAEAAWQVGFKDPSYFSKLYQEEFGETPNTTRK